MVVLYTTGCPHCMFLEAALKAKGIEHTIVKGEDAIIEKGFSSAPILEVDGVDMTFDTAREWINGRTTR